MKDYIVLDLETTGLSCYNDSIIEIGALIINQNEYVEKIDIIVNPGFDISPNITKLTGITNEMLKGAPTIEEVLPSFINKINNNTLVGHNISFDKSFLVAACKKLGLKFYCDYIDTKDISKELLKGLPYYSLENVCAALYVENENAHRALSDCIATNECYQKLLFISESDEEYQIPDLNYRTKSYGGFKGKTNEETKALQQLEGIIIGITCDDILTEAEVYALKSWLDKNNHLCGNYPFDKAAKAIKYALEDNILEQHELEEMLGIFKELVNPDFSCKDEDITIELDSKNVCVTGDFNFGSRSEVTKYLESKGALVKSGVSGKTDYVVVGDLGSDAWKHGNYGGKIKKAMELNEQGKNIVIISEEDFLKKLK